MNVRRRGVLGLGALAATTLALQTGALFGALGAPMTSDGRSYDASHTGLEIGGAFAGFVSQFQGGFTSSDVATEKVGADYFVKKHIAGVKYDDISFKVGPGMSNGVWDWLRASQGGEYQRRDGAFLIADSNLNEVRRINFYNALVTEIGFPTLDASSKDAGYFTVKFAPEEVKYVQGSGKSISVPAAANAQKVWSPSSFRISIDGLTTTNVSKVDAFTFKQTVIEAAIGVARDPVKMPAQTSTTNLKVTMTQADAASAMAWAQQVNAAGANKQTLAKNGTIIYLDATRQHELARVTFSGLLPVAVMQTKVEANQIARIVLEMTIGKASLTPGPATAF